jgi:hypothetical protein
MRKKIFNTSNRMVIYIIVALLVTVVIMVFGGSDWLMGTRVNQQLGISSWGWGQIILIIVIGFGLGWLAFRKPLR